MANETVGESSDLSKIIDFDGHEVDVHYACSFASSANSHSGVFGKVEVTPMFSEVNGFSFNLIKVYYENFRKLIAKEFHLLLVELSLLNWIFGDKIGIL